jgi:hypothetical protein
VPTASPAKACPERTGSRYRLSPARQQLRELRRRPVQNRRKLRDRQRYLHRLRLRVQAPNQGRPCQERTGSGFRLLHRQHSQPQPPAQNLRSLQNHRRHPQRR